MRSISYIYTDVSISTMQYYTHIPRALLRLKYQRDTRSILKSKNRKRRYISRSKSAKQTHRRSYIYNKYTTHTYTHTHTRERSESEMCNSSSDCKIHDRRYTKAGSGKLTGEQRRRVVYLSFESNRRTHQSPFSGLEMFVRARSNNPHTASTHTYCIYTKRDLLRAQTSREFIPWPLYTALSLSRMNKT